MAMKKMAMKKMAMKKMARKKSVIAKGKHAKSLVFRGIKVKTVGGLKKSDLKINKRGKVVSIKASTAGRKSWRNICTWAACIKYARWKLGLVGFVPVGGPTPAGDRLHATACARMWPNPKRTTDLYQK